jgi:choline-sulfatase
MKKKPNIIFIFSDQHRADVLGAMGHPVAITPNLDSIANEGVVFTNCFTPSPLCMPARASMMTGRQICEHGVWDNHTEANPKKEPSHVRNIRDVGYHTALIGKTHLYSRTTRKVKHLDDQKSLLEDWGFVESHETNGHMSFHRYDSIFSDYLEKKGLRETFREFNGEYVKRWNRGTDRPWEQKPSPLSPEDYLDSFVGRKAVKWIENYDKESPFYLQVLFPGPHDPFDSPQKYRDMYNPDKVPVALMEHPKEPIPYYTKMVLKWSNLKNMTPEQNKLYRSYYYAKITLIDEWIGKIVEALKQKGMLSNTWIIYSSDHGEQLGDHMLNHKMVFYENSIRIPCIIRPPSGIKPIDIQKTIDLIDVTATLLDIAGAKPISNSNGRSLVPVVQDNTKHSLSDKEAVFSEVLGYTMVRTKEFKLAVLSNNKKPVEFYDLSKDPNELENKVNDDEYKSIIKKLLGTYIKPYLRQMSRRKLRRYWINGAKRFISGKNYPKWVVDVTKAE